MIIDKKSYRKILPPISKDKKTNIAVSMDIRSIKNIDELAMVFNAEVFISLQWRDPRLTYKNLGSNDNFFGKFWTEQIWLPPLYFSNTESNHEIIDDASILVEVIRLGSPKPNELHYLDEGNEYTGADNDLKLSTQQQLDFQCTFELSKFPFDTQTCSLNIRIPREIRKFITLEPKTLNYSGKYFDYQIANVLFHFNGFFLFKYIGDRKLLQFKIDDPNFLLNDEGSKLKAEFIMYRQSSYMIIYAYIPSLAMMAMTIVPLYLRDDTHFSTTISLVVTAILCLLTAIQSSVSNIPNTAYLKFIDYWNIFTLAVTLTNFFTLILWELWNSHTMDNKWKSIKNHMRTALTLTAVFGIVAYFTIASLLFFKLF